VFDQLWYAVPGFGFVKSEEQAEGAVKKFTINGISVEYFSADQATASNSGYWIPDRVKPLLDYYRRESLLGVG
jgi:hypothetical protein